MPMPHRTQAQVIRRRLRRQGRHRSPARAASDPRGSTRLQERSLRRPSQVGQRGDRRTRVRAKGRPPRQHRRAPAGSRADLPRRRAQRGQVVPAASAVQCADQDRRLRLHDHATCARHRPASAASSSNSSRSPGSSRARTRIAVADGHLLGVLAWRGRDRVLPSSRLPRCRRCEVVRREVTLAGIERPALIAATKADERTHVQRGATCVRSRMVSTSSRLRSSTTIRSRSPREDVVPHRTRSGCGSATATSPTPIRSRSATGHRRRRRAHDPSRHRRRMHRRPHLGTVRTVPWPARRPQPLASATATRSTIETTPRPGKSGSPWRSDRTDIALGGLLLVVSLFKSREPGRLVAMPRAIWSGSISFGLVNIPVKLYNAVSRKTVSFNQLDRRTGARIKHKQVSAADGDEVPDEDIVKGYELAVGRLRAVDDDELAALDPEAVPHDRHRGVRRPRRDRPDLLRRRLLPGARQGHGEAVRPAGRRRWRSRSKVGIARFVMRTKQYLAAIRPKDGKLVLSTMVYADEVNDADEIAELDERRRRRGLRAGARRWPSSSSSRWPADFEPEQVPRHLPRPGARADRAQGGRRDEIVAAAAAGRARTRSSTSWPRSRRSVQAAKEARKRHPTAARRRRSRPTARPTAPSRRSRPAKKAAPSPQERKSARVGVTRARPSTIDGRAAQAVQPRQGPLPGGRVHQGRGHRLLRPHRAGDADPPRRPRRHPAALPERRRRSRSSRSAARRTGPTGSARALGPGRPQRRDRLLPARLDAAVAGVGGQPGRPRAARADGPRRRHRVADDGRVRPRPGRAGRHQRVRRGRPVDPRRARRPRPRVLRQDVGVEGPAALRAAQHAATTHEQASTSRSPSPRCSRSTTPTGCSSNMARPLRKGKVFIDWSQNSPPQDDGLRLLAAGPARRRRCRRRSRGTRSTPPPTARRCRSRPPTCSTASTSSATSGSRPPRCNKTFHWRSTLTSADTEAVAERLLEAYDNAATIDPISATIDGFDMPAATRCSMHIEARRADAGWVRVGSQDRLHQPHAVGSLRRRSRRCGRMSGRDTVVHASGNTAAAAHSIGSSSRGSSPRSCSS